MRLLDRFLGRPAKPRPPHRGATHLMVPILDARRRGKVHVVGTTHRQGNLIAIAGGRTRNGPANPDHVAGLGAEPDDAYGANAIVVQIDGCLVGYLSSEDEIRFAPVLQRAAAMGYPVVGCHASLTGGWDRGPNDWGYIGVILRIGTPAECLAELASVPSVG